MSRVLCQKCRQALMACPTVGCVTGFGVVHIDTMSHYCSSNHTWQVSEALPPPSAQRVLRKAGKYDQVRV